MKSRSTDIDPLVDTELVALRPLLRYWLFSAAILAIVRFLVLYIGIGGPNSPLNYV